MAKQERLAKGRECARQCGKKVAEIPSVSPVDKKQVCVDCWVDEFIGQHLEK